MKFCVVATYNYETPVHGHFKKCSLKGLPLTKFKLCTSLNLLLITQKAKILKFNFEQNIGENKTYTFLSPFKVSEKKLLNQIIA